MRKRRGASSIEMKIMNRDGEQIFHWYPAPHNISLGLNKAREFIINLMKHGNGNNHYRIEAVINDEWGKRIFYERGRTSNLIPGFIRIEEFATSKLGTGSREKEEEDKLLEMWIARDEEK